MLDHDELLKLNDRAYTQNQTTRDMAADDLVFYWVTQWDDALLDSTELQYRGEFNILRKAGRQIIADLRANPIQIDFEPTADSREDGADLLDGLYLADDRRNTTLESYDNASGEAVVCGVGAWELYTEYESNRMGNSNQVIRRRPVYEANNNLLWDPSAKRLDKSDAKYVSILYSYTFEGYKELVLELTGEEILGESFASFAQPAQSFAFPWITGGNEHCYVGTLYVSETVKDKALGFIDPMGQPLLLRESDLTEIMDDLLNKGYELIQERDIEREAITKYIVSGAEVLDSYEIVGNNIPVVPVYGERAFVEGEEHYEGVTRLAKDPQRLRNFQLSYLQDIVSRSPRVKPIFNPEQIQGFEFMYDKSGAENNFPYYLQQSKDAMGNVLPIGPVGVMPEATPPIALTMAIEQSRAAVEDVANPGLPKDIADADLSGKAVALLTNRLDQQSMVYQENMKHAKRRDAEIYAGMAVEVYDAPRKVSISKPDGTRKNEAIMTSILDAATGNIVILNDLSNMEFDVFAEIGPSYTSKREQLIEDLGKMITESAADPAMQKMLTLKKMTLMTGVGFDDIREYSRNQLILMGVTKPDTPEEEQMLKQSQEQQEPDAMMIAAQAEMAKAQADGAEVERKGRADELNAQVSMGKLELESLGKQNDQVKLQIEAAKLGIKGRELEVGTAKAVSDIGNKDADTVHKAALTRNTDADTALKLSELQGAELQNAIATTSTDELVRMLDGS